MDGVVQINQTLHVSMLISVCASRVLVHMCVYVYVCVSAASSAVFSDWVMWYSIFHWIYGHPELALIMETGEIWPYLVQTPC